MTVPETTFLLAGLLAGILLNSVLLWSFLYPTRRVWPPTSFNMKTPAIAWLLTVVVFASAIALGALGWGTLGLPMWVRWGLGLLLVVAGNVVVWSGVHHIGMDATSGAEAELVTSELYSHSRNPQYVADICILIGIGLLSAAFWVWPVIVVGVVALILAPFAEEPWLQEKYGAAFDAYRVSTRRFL